MGTFFKVVLLAIFLLLVVPFSLSETFNDGLNNPGGLSNSFDYLTDGSHDSGVSYWSIPFILSALVVEIIISLFNSTSFNKKDTMVNIMLGLAIVGCVSIVKGWELFIYSTAWSFALFEIPVNPLSWLACLLGYDFLFYWFHRFGHEVNFLWAAHNTHHSSTEFNFSIGARNNILHVFYRFLFWTPLCLVGFHPVVVMTIDSLCTVYQFFLHTKIVRKLKFLDQIICTPSNHRVHHGCNDQYIDKNYGGYSMIWDHIFGTYEVEVEPVKFGLTTGEVSYSFLNLIFGYWVLMLQRLSRGGDFIRIFFGRPSK